MTTPERGFPVAATHLPAPANCDRCFAGLPPVNTVGATEHFAGYYQRDLGETGRQAAAQVLNRAEPDLLTIRTWFAAASSPGDHFDIVVARLPGGPGAVWERDRAGTTLEVDLPVTPQSEPLQASWHVAVLLTDLAARSAGWDGATAAVLARVAATSLYPRRVAGFATGWMWLDGDRELMLDAPPGGTAESSGCAALFVNHLHHQLGFSWWEILGRAAPSLAALAERLTGADREPERFRALVDRAVPPGQAVSTPSDNIFPVADPPPPEPAVRPAAGSRRAERERRVCLLTGASGTLGRHLIEHHGDRYEFAAVYRSNPPPSGVHAIQADLGLDGEPERVVAAALERFGRIDLVVNAAVASTWGPMLSSSSLHASAPRQFLTNVVVPLRLASVVAEAFWAERLDENREAARSVVNLSSVSGLHLYANEGQSVYAATKAALDHLTGHMALEFAPIGVRVNAVAPNSFPSNVPTDRVAGAVIRLDEGDATGAIVVVDGAEDRLIQLASTPVPAAAV